jgi:hypothetical protein
MNGVTNGTSHLELPPADSPSILLGQPTPAERDAQTRLNGVSWRGALTLDGYIGREAHLSDQDATRNGRQEWWVLAHTSESGERRVLCGCETYEKRALVAERGEVRETTAYAIGSVYCEERNRGKGYAGRMLLDVAEMLGRKGCGFSVLYSDIGKVRIVKFVV